MKKKVKKKLKGIIAKLFDLISDGIGPHYKRLENANKNLLAEHINYTYGDQKGQVNFLINNVFNYENNGLPRDGFFVDLACADGVLINNTYFLERCLGWNGLLFEPNPGYKENIQANRKSPLITDCVTDKIGDRVRFRIDNGMLGGIVSDETDNSEAIRSKQLKKAEIIEISTTTLELELEKIKAPNLIDFLSLDIEGAEWIAMRNFSFGKYKFRCMAIERPNEELDLLLDLNGYKQVAHLVYDVIYVHKDFLSDVNFDPRIRFSFTPRKNS